jgi:hypothetical protein
VHNASAQHAHHFLQQGRVVPARIFGRKDHVIESRRGIAFGVGDQFHQQHAVAEAEGMWDSNAGRGQAVERVDLGALPGGFGCLAPEYSALGFGVVDGLTKAALGRLLVDLGATSLPPQRTT